MPDWLHELLGVFAYLAALAVIGILASRRMGDVRDYFAGGKDMGFWAIAFSARATGESAWLLLGLTGMAATLGLQAVWVVIGELIGISVAWWGLSFRFKRLTDRYDSLTIPDYLESRFRDDTHVLRLTAAVAIVVFVTIYVSAQIDATGAAFETFLGWNYYTGIAVGFAVVLLYIVSGGFVAVVWSDVFQGTLMALGLVVLPIVALVSRGGWTPIEQSLRATDPTLLEFGIGSDPVAIAGTVGLLCIGLGFMGSPQIFVRFVALRSEREIAPGAVVAIVWTLLADCGAIAIGLIGRAVLVRPASAVEQLGNGGQDVLPLLVEHTMPALLVGLYIAVVLAAIMSTIDSLLVLAASALVRDWYQQVHAPRVPDDALVGRSRIATVVLALAAAAIALIVAATTPERTVFWFVIFGWSGIAATFCPTMILSLLWSGLTVRGALAAMITGFVGVPLFKFAGPLVPGVGPTLAALSELPPAFAASFLAGIAVSAAAPLSQARRQDLATDLEEASRPAPPTDAA